MVKYMYKGKKNEKVPSNVTLIEIESTVKIIREKAFSQCESLIYVDIPSSVEVIEEYAFCLCSSLKGVSMTSSVKVIEQCAFLFCFALASIDIPSSITIIEESAFQFCVSLSNIHFCPLIKSMDEGSSLLMPIQGNEVIVEEEDRLLSNRDNETMIVTKNATNKLYISWLENLFYLIYHSFISFIFKIFPTSIPSTLSTSSSTSTSTSTSTSASTSASTSSTENLIDTVTIKKKKDYKIPTTSSSSVKSIKRCAFFGCGSLKTVHIPRSVQNIASDAFNNCPSMQKIYLPSECTYENTSFTSWTRLIHAWYDIGPLICLRRLVQMNRATIVSKSKMMNDRNLFIIQAFITSTNEDIFRNILEFLISNVIHVDKSDNVARVRNDEESNQSDDEPDQSHHSDQSESSNDESNQSDQSDESESSNQSGPVFFIRIGLR